MTDFIRHGTGRSRRRNTDLPSARDKALALAALYRLLALAFSNPEPGLVPAVVKGLGELKAALTPGAFPVRIAHALKAAEPEWRSANAGTLVEEYSRLFLGSGPVPLREGGFGDGLQFAGQPAGIADISGFYLAFGVKLPDNAAGAPDHICTELEFMSLLHLKLALALRRRESRHATIARTAMAHFLKDHLARWAGPFETALVEASAGGPYRMMGCLLARCIEEDCTRLRVLPRKASAGTGIDPAGGDHMVCPFGQQSVGETS